ncbi:OLC1v1027486C1 [Oldenlandia corymbosa var. corymbosa]|uniref:OLC1v1027486C1 n=1 Tax=Oldenlandia corymbosa var. corymbosa TaxID=529605 RepID=A0AAV1CCB8_OLDCO|nr:OLC1v1027486C1 [Oldenlandia corymbosa var. corymbosa]
MAASLLTTRTVFSVLPLIVLVVLAIFSTPSDATFVKDRAIRKVPIQTPPFFGNDDTSIGNGSMKGDDPQCAHNPQNCRPSPSGNPYRRGCSPLERCRCCRRMLLEDQLQM